MNYRIFLIFVIMNVLLYGQSPDELKKFMETYDKLKIDQQANDVVKKGIENESGLNDGPVKLLVTPADVSKYYDQKIYTIKDELDKLSDIIAYTDTIRKITNFGYSYFFSRDTISFIDNLKITDDYVLGYGDEIIISVWGQVEQYEKKIIQRDGSIYIDNVGLLNLSGLSLAEARSNIKNRFSNVYSTLISKPQLTYINISIGKVKKINVILSGHLRFPGNYVVNPSINIINLLSMAGGITKNGSLRNVILKRKNKIIDVIDFYPLISGSSDILVNSKNLMDGDVIVVSPKNSSVPLTGAINIPAYFELKNDNIMSLINFAGGLRSKSNSQVHLYRKNLPNQVISDFKNSKLEIIQGDSLFFPTERLIPAYLSISIDNRNLIKIPWIDNLSYRQIFTYVNIDINNIKNIELVRKTHDNKFERYILQNFENGNFIFKPFDFISIQIKNSYKELRTIIVNGAIVSPGEYPLLGDKENVNSIIERAGGFISSANIMNVKVKRDTLFFGSIDGNLILAPNDTIIVENFNGSIKIKGEVNNPGIIEWKESRRIKDYIALSGGLTSYADKRQIIYIKPYGEAIKIRTNNKSEILPGGTIIVNQKPTNELNARPDRFQQFSSIISSLVTIALLARTTSN